MWNELKKWVVNDYFTPNIKAEVILDALLTRYIAGIIKDQCEVDAGFITKEMSVTEMSASDTKKKQPYGNRGTKIDYILADAEAVYLVELKTTEGSIEKQQAKRYRENCSNKKFGEVFGDKLMKIMENKTGVGLKEAATPEDQLKEQFKGILEKHDRIMKEECYAEQAKELLKQCELGSTYKYLYTMGQLLDYICPNPNEKRTLWKLPLKLIYITPYGTWPHKDLENDGDFYLYPKEKGSVSLEKAGAYLRQIQGDELAGLLAGIIKEIYGE